MNPASHAPAYPRRAMLKIALMGLAGTSIEWYDFFLYGLGAALVFPTVFFPQSMPPVVAQLASYSTFAVGFFARPLGALVFGHVGDRFGRKRALAAALVLMGTATSLIGCLPTYATAGPVAPVLLVALRFMQGLAIGGQWGGAMLLVVENAPPGKRGFYGSFAQVGAPAGVVLANLAFLAVSALAPPGAFLDGAWRIPFLLSVLLVALGLYVHFRVEDTRAYLELRQRVARDPLPATRAPVLEVITRQPRLICLAAGSFVATNVIFYIVIAFSVSYLTAPDGLNVSRTLVLGAILLGSAIQAPGLLVFGALSDRWGRRRVYMTGAALSALFAFAIFPLFETRSLFGIALGVGVAQGLTAMMYGPQAALFSELFKTRVRYSGASLGYQLGSIFGGALAPIIATAITAKFHSTLGISSYIAIACLVSFVSIALLGETSAVDLNDPAPHAESAVAEPG
jgi:MFS family permease